MLLTYVVLRLQHVLPFNPQHFPAVVDRQAFETAASFTTNTNWQSYFGRVDDVVLLPDEPARVPQLRLGRGRRGGGRGAGPGHRAALRGPAGQLLGRSGARHAVHLPPALVRHRPGPRAAGRHPELPAVCGRPHAGGRQADHRDGPGREPGSHQGGRHQRRRVLQRQLGAWIRESDPAHELPAAAGDLPRLGRAHLDLRPHGEEAGARLGAVGGDVRHVLRRRRSPPTGPRPGATRFTRPGASTSRPPPPSPAATWRARRSGSAS